LTVNEDGAVKGNLLDGASDVDGDRLTVSNFTQPANGVLAVDANGEFVYVPNADFSGNDSFSYTVDDGQGGTTTETVSVAVDAVADGVQFDLVDGQGQEHDPIALDIKATMLDADGSEEIASVLVKDIPAAAELSAGTRLENGDWLLTADELHGLTVQFDQLGNAGFNLTVEITTVDGDAQRVQSETLSVDVKNDVVVGTMFQQLLAGEQIVENPELASIDYSAKEVVKDSVVDSQLAPATASSSAASLGEFATVGSDGGVSEWDSPEWDAVQSELDSGAFDNQSSEGQNSNSESGVEQAETAQPMFLMGLESPDQLVAEDRIFESDQLATQLLELDNWDQLAEVDGDRSTARLTAASLLGLFTIKEDKRRKLKERSVASE
jgi:hypothetical protein